MKLSRTLQIAAATAVCMAAAAQSALAGGEPKNVPPFTRSATGGRSTAQVLLSPSAIASARIAIMGEAKNQLPFTRAVNNADALTRFLSQYSQFAAGALSGEPKNQAPFTRRLGRRT